MEAMRSSLKEWNGVVGLWLDDGKGNFHGGGDVKDVSSFRLGSEEGVVVW